jgi:thioredoxin-like negative regulator of GroEL
LAAGELAPDEASSILQAMAAQVRDIEATEIEQRIAALEQAAVEKGK